ncbi:MAG: TonB-dependent receptor [Gammaproteobacteria bacterium]|nr:TonB-dependent receptor [Gammaproteobacteria bacterium]
MNAFRAFSLAIGFVLVAAHAGPIQAEEAEGARSGAIEEILVTARKREESLQEVPVAVSAFTGDQMTDSGIDQFSDLAPFTPGLAINQHSTYANATADGLVMRGQSSGGTQISNDPAVGVYIDGVVNPHVTGMQMSFFDLERIEVLKGPQGTLFGRNTTGGAINIITRKADYDDVHGYIEVDGGNHDTLNYRGAVNIPIIADRMAVRLAYQHNNRDGYGKSALTGQRLGGDRDEDYVRGSLRLDFDTVRIMLVGDWGKERENGPLVVTRGAYFNATTAIDATFLPASGCGPFDIPCGLGFMQMRAQQGGDDIFTNYTDLHNFDDTDIYSVSATIEWDITDAVTLKSITGYRDMEHTHLTNFSGSDFKAIVTGDPNFPDRELHQAYDVFTQELNLSGVAMDGRLDWLGGAFFSDDNGSDTDYVNLAENFKPINGTPYFFTFDAPLVDQESWALFSQMTYAVTDTINFTAGGRYTEEKKEQVNAHGTLLPDGAGGLFWSCGNANFVGPVFAPIDQRYDFCSLPKRSVTYDGWSWLFSVDWQATDNVMVYVKASEGFRGGGFDIRSAGWPGGPPGRPPFEPETATDWEVGLKADWFDYRLRTNLAAYTTKYKNKQETVIIPGPSTVTRNAGKADIDGFEAEIRLEPADGLNLFATVAWMKGKYSASSARRWRTATSTPPLACRGIPSARNPVSIRPRSMPPESRWVNGPSVTRIGPIRSGAAGKPRSAREPWPFSWTMPTRTTSRPICGARTFSYRRSCGGNSSSPLAS